MAGTEEMVKDWERKLDKHQRFCNETKDMWERARKLIEELPSEKLTGSLELEGEDQEMLQKAKDSLAKAEEQKTAAVEELRKSEQVLAEMEAKSARWEKALKLSRMIVRASPARPGQCPATPLLDSTNAAPREGGIKRKRLTAMPPPSALTPAPSVCTPVAARRRSLHAGMPAPPTGGYGTAKTLRTWGGDEGRSPSMRPREEFDFAGIDQLIGDVQRGPSLMSVRTVDTVD
eukprot:Hpha_TRINITY_DN14706_c0_g2::TRINITY_DN14706_c0_g2_i1::g.102910::m.102910